MGFWDTALGTAPAPAPAAPQQPAPAAPAVQQGAWWQQGAYTGQPVTQPVTAAPAGQQATADNQGEWGTVEGSTRRAKSARLDQRCPDCGSTNYFKPDGQPNAMTQCYECGSNPRFSQLTQGAGLPGGEAAGPATPARQVGEGGGRGGVSNFNPQTVIGRVN